jgi:hypothetical protein
MKLSPVEENHMLDVFSFTCLHKALPINAQLGWGRFMLAKRYFTTWAIPVVTSIDDVRRILHFISREPGLVYLYSWIL